MCYLPTRFTRRGINGLDYSYSSTLCKLDHLKSDLQKVRILYVFELGMVRFKIPTVPSSFREEEDCSCHSCHAAGEEKNVAKKWRRRFPGIFFNFFVVLHEGLLRQDEVWKKVLVLLHLASHKNVFLQKPSEYRTPKQYWIILNTGHFGCLILKMVTSHD